MNRMFLRLLSGMVLVMALGLSGAAWGGSISAVGEPKEVGSWAQTFQWYPPPANIDTIESFIVSGATNFEAPGLRFFSNGWGGTLVNPDYTIAQGNAASAAFTFQSVYTANPDVSFYQDFIGYYQRKISEAWSFHWRGSDHGGWELVTGKDIKDGVLDGSITENRSPAPLPSTVLLLGSGLVGLVGLRWRRRQAS